MNTPMPEEIEQLSARLNALLDRAGLDHDAQGVASEALEELAVVVEELQAQNAELESSLALLDQERCRYRDLFQTVPDGYVVTDSRGVIREANTTASQVLGAQDLVGTPLGAFIDGADQRSFYSHLNGIDDPAGDDRLSVNLAVRDHPRLPVNLRAIASADTNGEVSVRWLIHDRRSEIETATLRESEERLRALFDTAAVGVVLCATDGSAVFANRAAGNLLDHPQAPVADAWLDATHPDDRRQLDDILQGALHEGRSGSLRHRVCHRDGAVHWVEHEIVPVAAAETAISGSVSTLVDVTAEESSREHLRRSRAFTETVMDTIGVLVVVLDINGKIRRCNTCCERVTGWFRDELIGRHVLELIPDEQHRISGAAFIEVLERGVSSVENEWFTAGGDRRLIAWDYAVLRTEDGRVWAVVASGTDVTDRRRLLARLTQSDRLESTGRLAAGVAHDLNNTLTVVSLRTERLLRREHDLADTKDLEAVTRTVEHSKDLLADLLAFGRGQTLTPQPVAVNERIDALSTLLGDLIGDNVRLQRQLTSESTLVLMDPRRLDQVLTNVVTNASDAMADGGILTIRTTREFSDEVRVGDGPPGTGPWVQVCVADTGSGIAPDDLPHVFEPYFTTKSGGRGTGLGLSSTYGVVAQSGGTVTIDSEPGVGTTVRVWLPLHDPDHAEPGADAAGLARPASEYLPTPPPCVLLVEDDAELRTLLVEELESDGWTVMSERSGEGALRHLEHAVDLLVTDVQLPGIDGVELAALFSERRPELKVVFITGAPAEGLRHLPDSALVVPKPFPARDLLAVVRAELHRGT